MVTTEKQRATHRRWMRAHPTNVKKYRQRALKRRHTDRVYRAEYERKHAEILQRGLDYIRASKERPCTDCGYQFHHSAMQFDHRPGTIKLFAIGTKGKTHRIETIQAEIAKCDVVCANCHATRTWVRRTTNPSAFFGRI